MEARRPPELCLLAPGTMTYEPKNAYRTRTCRTQRYLKDVVFLNKQHLTHARARERARGKQFERPCGPCHGPCAPPLRGGDWWPGGRGYAPQSSPPRGANGPQGLRAPRNRLWPIPHLRTRQLVRRPVAGMMCSAGYAKNRLKPIFFTLPPHPGVHWTPGQARHHPGEPPVVREGPKNRLSERGRGA